MSSTPRGFLSLIFGARNGPDEFVIVGTIKPWNITDIVDKITQPTLVINGLYDMAQDNVVKPFVDTVPDVKWVRFDKSSHLPCWEESELYYKVVSDFLTL